MYAQYLIYIQEFNLDASVFQSAEYITKWIKNESKIVKPEQIIVGGFGQGAAMALLTG